jgi:hypothetical protein
MREKFEAAYCKIFMDVSGGETAENLESVESLRNGGTYDDEHLALMWCFVKLVHGESGDKNNA